MTTDPVRAVIRETYGRVVYTHKIHEKNRELCSRRAVAVRWVNIVLTGLTGGGIVAAAIIGSDGYLWASAILATFSLSFNVFQLSFDPAKDAARHRATAKSLLPIRDGYTNLLADLASGLDVDSARLQRDKLEKDLNEILQQAPDTSPKAYLAAQKALKVNNEGTFTETEIDSLLPSALRIAELTETTHDGDIPAS
jgi:hypothetical protein